MVKLDKGIIKAYQSGNETLESVAQHLLKNYTSIEIAEALAEILAEPATSGAQAKIAVTEDELKTITDLFRIKGTSNRGRKKLKSVK